MCIVWLHGTGLCEEEEALGCPGSVEEEEVLVQEEEEGEDLRGANSLVEEGAEEGGADMFAPSPGKFTWALTATIHRPVWVEYVLSPWKRC